MCAPRVCVRPVVRARTCLRRTGCVYELGRVSGQPARLEEQRPGADRFRLPPPLDARDVAYCIMLPPFGACHGSLCSRHALDTRTPCSRPRRIPHPRPPPHPRDHARLPEIIRGYPRVPESRPPPGPRPPSWGALCATAHRRHIARAQGEITRDQTTRDHTRSHETASPPRSPPRPRGGTRRRLRHKCAAMATHSFSS